MKTEDIKATLKDIIATLKVERNRVEEAYVHTVCEEDEEYPHSMVLVGEERGLRKAIDIVKVRRDKLEEQQGETK